jgi:hypothetical protein
MFNLLPKYSYSAASKSTDKLRVLTETLQTIDPAVLARVKEFKLEWKVVCDTAVPEVKITFKD